MMLVQAKWLDHVFYATRKLPNYLLFKKYNWQCQYPQLYTSIIIEYINKYTIYIYIYIYIYYVYEQWSNSE